MRIHSLVCLVEVPAYLRTRAPVLTALVHIACHASFGVAYRRRGGTGDPRAAGRFRPIPHARGMGRPVPVLHPRWAAREPPKTWHVPCDTAGLGKKTGDEKSKPRNFVENSKFRRNFDEISSKGALLPSWTTIRTRQENRPTSAT